MRAKGVRPKLQKSAAVHARNGYGMCLVVHQDAAAIDGLSIPLCWPCCGNIASRSHHRRTVGGTGGRMS